MERTVLVVTVLASLCGRGVFSLSSGAPLAACDTLTPNAASHGAQPQVSAVPFAIDLSPFDSNGTLQYNPGQTYTLSLSGNNQEQFRGFFVQARLVADDTTRTGTFAVTVMNSRLSSCPTPTDGITHNNGLDKSSVSFDWTAPPAGTGAITFGFAVVQVRITYWANQRTAMIAEGAVSGAIKLTSTGFLTILLIALGLVLRETF